MEALFFIIEHAEFFNGILYAGKLPKDVALIHSNMLIWDEDCHGILKWILANCNKKEINCPIVYIYDNDCCGLDVAYQLQVMFLEAEYQCVCI